jgi:succinate dehydrogenase/fumarate reductase iron-sulfur protein
LEEKLQTSKSKLIQRSYITIDVLRSDPSSVGNKPAFVQYEIPSVPQITVLDALQYVREELDGTLAFNYSCQKQRCGSCAMKIGGKISLACYTPAHDGLKIAPLPGFQVAKDLVVDWTPYEGRMEQLVPEVEKSSKKVIEKNRELAESASTCISCFSCVGACPTVDIRHQTGFAGPAISVMLASFLDRATASDDFLSSIENANLEYCTRCYACNTVCPAEINIVGCIQELQKHAASSDSQARYLNEMTRGFLY